LEKDCLEWVELGTDQFVTEKIVKLEQRIAELESNLNKCKEVLLEIHKTAEDSDWSRFVSFVESETGNILEEVFGELNGNN